jgi:hypothetical protein
MKGSKQGNVWGRVWVEMANRSWQMSNARIITANRKRLKDQQFSKVPQLAG